MGKPPSRDGFVEDLFEGFLDVVHLLVAFVGEESGMQIAIAHVAKRADAQVVFLRDGGDEADHLGQFVAGHGGVLENGCRREAGQRRERTAACGGELVRLGVILGDAHFHRAVFRAHSSIFAASSATAAG